MKNIAYAVIFAIAFAAGYYAVSLLAPARPAVKEVWCGKALD
jgi:hypothetical protein